MRDARTLGAAQDDEVRGGGALRVAPDDADRDRHRTLGGAKGLPQARLLTPPATDAVNPVFSPDGEWVYFIAALHETADDDVRTQIYRVPVADGQDPELVAPTGGTQSILAATFAGDTLLAATQDLGETGLDFVAKLVGICAIDTAGEARLLTDPEAEDFGGHDGFVAPGENNTVLIPRCDRGGNAIVRFDSNGEYTEVLPRGERVITGAAEKSGTLAVTYSDPTTPGELAVVRHGELVTLSDFARSRAAPVAQREFTATGPDGYPVHGWVFLPDGDGPHPVLLNIHGGPFADYTWGYFDEPQVLAEAGYAVVQCNPRGSQGYGRAHGLAVKERMGTVDMQDVLAFLDGAIAEFDELDGERVGILGGSYGGYLTAWTIAHEHRFAAAIVERGYLDPLAFIGTSDIGWFFSEEYVGRDVEHALTQSPQAVAHQVRTPTLVMHSEEDWRCPPDQAQRYFASLRRAGVETEMLLFPGENHELSRSGTPWHRRERFEAMLAWWARYLPVRAG
ncbi:MAG: S9 family peptidase [Ruaniaceae bacterium]|nr:S9 family peptidase [Ruaniaceae bacterium]